MYHKGWIDFNKNGVMDIYEDPKAPLEDRVQDLLSHSFFASLCNFAGSCTRTFIPGASLWNPS